MWNTHIVNDELFFNRDELTSSSHIGPSPGPKYPSFFARARPPNPKDLQITVAAAFEKSSSQTVPHMP